jgi:hypothetical protein
VSAKGGLLQGVVILTSMTSAEQRLRPTATGQLGAFTRDQAAASGLTNRQLRHRVQSGAFDQIGPNAFRLASIDPSTEALLHGLILDVGGAVWVSGRTAAALYGFDGFELRAPFHLTIERGRDVQRVGHKIHTTKVLPDADQCERHGFVTMRPARVLIDLARNESVTDLTAAVESALRDRWVSEASLRKRAVELHTRGRFGIEKLIAVLDERDRKLGAHSWLEREFLELIESASLPRPDCQSVLSRSRDRVVRVDFRFPGTALVVEVMGYRFHRTKEQMQCDAERLNALILDGFLPVQITYEDVVERPAHIVATVTRAYVSATTTP